MIHFWTNAMGGLSYVTGFPIANCDRVLCGAGLAADFPDVYELGDCEGDQHSIVQKEVTCPNCIYLLSIPGTYRLNLAGRLAKLRLGKHKRKK